MYVELCYIIDALHHTYPRQHRKKLSNTTELFPVQKKLPSLFTEDAVKIAESYITEALQNPATSRPTSKLGKKKQY